MWILEMGKSLHELVQGHAIYAIHTNILSSAILCFAFPICRDLRLFQL